MAPQGYSPWPEPEIMANYPGVSADDIRACIQYAREALQYEHVQLLHA
ncbi:MAG TPA: DUF433 domain-containing protein [Gemmatimonadaceae bacterium]|nr:DUF433 domain-containing protein [Gemmatimonadaceae bacterium]